MKDLHTLVPSQVNLGINFNSNPVKALNPFVLAFVAGVRKGRGIGDAMADLGEGPGGTAPTPLFLDQTEARRAGKSFSKPGIPLTDIHTCFFISGSG